MISSPNPDNILESKKQNQPILEVRGLSVTFPGENGGLEAIQNMTFSIEAQEFICLLGPSGSGKSTLLRVLAGLLEPTEGCFASIQPPTTAAARRGSAMFFKMRTSCPGALSVKISPCPWSY